MEKFIIYAIIGSATGWLLAWAMSKNVPSIIKFLIFGAIGGLAGGFLIDSLMRFFRDIAPMAGAALGALVLLAYIRKDKPFVCPFILAP